MQNVPPDLRIKVIFADESIVVINKPCNLRSVPGHSRKLEERTKSPDKFATGQSHRRTAQEAWEAAIRTFASEEEEEESTNIEHSPLKRLANSPSLSCVPRKWKSFSVFAQRNRRRLFSSDEQQDIESITKRMYQRIEERQAPLLCLPEKTKNEESALGQLVLLGYGGDSESKSNPQQLYVVHRLDCETSGVMVFARNREAASFLSKVWRERNDVTKVYWARVQHWPPYRNDNKKLEGRIDLPLSPSEERLKWKVSKDGKPSTTLWRVKNESVSGPVVLVLTPVTGRTHQLRIHCAHTGCAIEGDSLYGEQGRKQQLSHEHRLCLHAQTLSFPHPKTKRKLTFETAPFWSQGDATSAVIGAKDDAKTGTS